MQLRGRKPGILLLRHRLTVLPADFIVTIGPLMSGED
jgi:hypothetical protein